MKRESRESSAGSCPGNDSLLKVAADPMSAPEVLGHLESCEACRTRIEDLLSRDPLVADLRLAYGSRGAAPIAPPGYRVLREVSRGGQGVVYEAVHDSTARRVALKVLIGGRWSTEAQQRRFKREARLAARLRHPNLVRVFDAGEFEDGTGYLVMEWVDGVPLDRWVAEVHRRGGREAREALFLLFDRVAEAVDEAHRAGVLHRDLKPSNVLVDENGEPRLIDFGLAKDIQRSGVTISVTNPDGFAGSLLWAAPEQIKPGKDVDTRTDVHGLGLLLHFLFTGEAAFGASSSMPDLMRNIANASPEPVSQASKVPGLGTELDRVVARALAKRPEKRYASAELLRVATAHARRRPSSLIGLFRRYQRVVIVAAALILIVAWSPWEKVVAARELSDALSLLEAGDYLAAEEALWDLAYDSGLDFDAEALEARLWRAGGNQLDWALVELYARTGWTGAGRVGVRGRMVVQSLALVNAGLAIGFSSPEGSTVEIWDCPPRSRLRTLDGPALQNMILFSDVSGRWLAGQSTRLDKPRRLVVWDLSSGQNDPHWVGDVVARGGGFLPGNRLLIGVSDQRLGIVDLATRSVELIPRTDGCAEIELTDARPVSSDRYLSISPTGRLACDVWRGCDQTFLSLTEPGGAGGATYSISGFPGPFFFLNDELAWFQSRLVRIPNFGDTLAILPRLSRFAGPARLTLAEGAACFMRVNPGASASGLALVDTGATGVIDSTLSHRGSIYDTCYLPGERKVVASDSGGFVRGWIPQAAGWLRTHQVSDSSSPDGVHGVHYVGSSLLSANGSAGTVSTWSPDGARSVTLGQPGNPMERVTGVDMSEGADPQIAASSGRGVFLDVNFNSPQQSRPNYTFPGGALATRVRYRPGSDEVAVVSDRAHLAVLSADAEVLFRCRFAGERRTGVVAWSVDGEEILVGSNSGKIYSVRPFEKVASTLDVGGTPHSTNIGALEISLQGLWASGDYNGKVAIWGHDHELISVLSAGGRQAYALGFHGDLLVVGTFDGQLGIWDPRTGRRLFRLDLEPSGFFDLDVRSDGGEIAIAGAYGQIWRIDVDALVAAVADHAPAFLRR
ncbi:MAG: serine/threonine-protein kinase [Planctomycetota bacterium]